MSSKTTTPEVPVDEPSSVKAPTRFWTDPALTGDDELPFESPEFGVGGFFPHLDTPTDGFPSR